MITGRLAGPAPLGSRAASLRPSRAIGAGPAISDLCGLGAVAAAALGVAALFAISPLTLESWGVSYTASGGGVLAKFHPATLILLGALALRCLAAPAPTRTALRLVTSDHGVLLLLAAVAVASVFAIGVDKVPVTPLVDTFVLPVITFLLLRDLHPAALRWLAWIVVAIMAANAVIAILELVRGWRLVHFDLPSSISADPTLSNSSFDWRAELAIDWRASALLGHPLVNGLITGAYLLCLVSSEAPWLKPPVRLALLALSGASMFAFGARTALVLTAALGAWLATTKLARAIAGGFRLDRRLFAMSLLVFAAVLMLGFALIATGYVDHTLERFNADAGSATTRLRMFALLEPMSWSDLVLKPDKDLVATLQRIQGLEYGIESSWLGLLLIYGAVVTAVVLAGLAAFAASVLRRCAHGAGCVLLLYFILVSVSASMSGKTTTFAMTVAMLMLFLRKGRSGLAAAHDGVV